MIFGYTRVSTAEQAADGTTSLEEQERVIRGYAMAKGVAAFGLQVYVDAGVSGSIPLHLRKQGGEMIDQIKPGDTVVASKLDRIFRNSLDALKTYTKFKEQGIHLVLFDMGIEPVTGDSNMAKVIFQVMAAFADHERERIRERIMDGKRAKREKGGFLGGKAPIGWRIVGQGRTAHLEPNDEERDLVVHLHDYMAQLPRPPRLVEIKQYLEREGHRTRKGTPFNWEQTKRMMIKATAHAVH